MLMYKTMNIKNIFKKRKIDLEKVYYENKEFFESMLLRDFVGYIPKELKEPTVKIFSDHCESLQKWILWQSHFINRKALHDPIKITKYDGMMIYLKVLYLMAEANKKPFGSTQSSTIPEKEKEVPWVERALDGVLDFTSNFKKTNDKTENNKGNKNSKSKDL